MARLGDIFTISSGGTPDKRQAKYYENGTIPWVKTGDLKEKRLYFKTNSFFNDRKSRTVKGVFY